MNPAGSVLFKTFEKIIKKMSYRINCGIFVFHLIDYQQVIATAKNGDSYNHCSFIVFQRSLFEQVRDRLRMCVQG